MTREETLKAHLDQIAKAQAEVKKAYETYTAYNDAFMAWLSSELKIENKKDVHLTEILSKWTEANASH